VIFLHNLGEGKFSFHFPFGDNCGPFCFRSKIFCFLSFFYSFDQHFFVMDTIASPTTDIGSRITPGSSGRSAADITPGSSGYSAANSSQNVGTRAASSPRSRKRES
jgi:hypothetical protein